MQYDFRQLYTSVLSQWFQADTQHLNTVMMKSFDQVPLLATTSVQSPQSSISTDSMTIRNYPNPCSAQTRIEYVLPQSGNIHLALFDALGHQITTIREGFQESGAQSVPFDASDLSSGAYFYTLRTGFGFISGKLTVSR